MAVSNQTPTVDQTTTFIYRPDYKPTSLYSKTKIVGKYLGYYEPIVLSPHPLDQTTTINRYRYHYRPDLLALDYYGDDNLFYIIPMRNGFQDLVYDLIFGATIIIPHPSYVQKLTNG